MIPVKLGIIGVVNRSQQDINDNKVCIMENNYSKSSFNVKVRFLENTMLIEKKTLSEKHFYNMFLPINSNVLFYKYMIIA